MLATSIARVERIKFEEARVLLHRELTEIIGLLRRRGEFRIGNIGKLILADQGLFDFKTLIPTGTLLNSIGTPEIHLSNPADEISQPEQEEYKEEDNILSPSGQNSSPAEDKDTYIRVLSKKNYYIPVNKIFARCAASLIVIVAIALSFLVPDATPSNDNEVKASLDPAETLVAKRTDVSKIAQSEPQQISDPEKIDQPGEEDLEQVEKPSGYYLIVGTFPGQKEAELFIRERDGGLYPLQAVERNGLWRISAGHGDYTTLQSILNSSEFRAAFSEAWIWNADKNRAKGAK